MCNSTLTFGLMRSMAALALSSFDLPTEAVSWMTCRWRLERDTVSSPGADDQHAGALELLLAGAADFRQHDVARIAFEFFR